MNFPQDLIKFLRKTTKLAVLTGAGVSQESGLRTFRDAQTGLWAQYKPEDLVSPQAFARDPKLIWVGTRGGVKPSKVCGPMRGIMRWLRWKNASHNSPSSCKKT